METLFGTLIGLLAVAALPGSAVALLLLWLKLLAEKRSGAEEWQAAAARLGLEKVRWRPGFHGKRVWYRGEIDGFIVQIQDSDADTADSRPWLPSRIGALRILVEAHGRWPHDVELHRRTTDANEDGWATGDPEFDGRIVASGSETHTVALLDQRTRKTALALVGDDGGALAGGRLHCDVRPAAVDMPTMVARGRRVVDLAEHLAVAEDVPTRLRKNSREDPLASVRLRNLTLLLDHLAAHPQTELACRAALGDPDPAVRLRAAAALGADGHEALTALALGHDAPEPLAAEAASLALRQLPVAAARGLYDRLVAQARTPLLVAAMAALAERHLAEAVPAIVPLLRAPTHDVRVSAARTLGVVGTTTAIGALHAAAASHPLDFELHRVVNAAVSAIQSRVAGAGPGQLSLAVSNAGQVSLSGPGVAQGQVSLASPGDTRATPDTSQGP
jgi:hypothetical protein